MNLADVLDPRDDDATEVAVYTTTEEVTRAELRARAEALSALLRERGLQPGQAVGVMLPNGSDIVAALFGIWFAGGVYVPLNPRLSADELAHVIAEDRPTAIVTRADDAARVTDVPVVLATGDGTWEAPGELDADAPRSPPGVAAISFTSGTTGRPKPVPLVHDNVLGLIDGVLGTLRGGATAGTDAPKKAPMPNLIPTSLSLWAGIYNVIFAFRAGAAVIVMDRFDTHAFAGFVERFQLRSTVLPPAAMTMLVDDESITSLTPLKYVRSITAPLSPLQARRFRDRFGVFVLNGWGQTEIGGEIVGWSAQDAKEFGDTHLGAVGRAHENVRLRISEDQGEILVQTPMIDERSATGDDMDGRLVDGWFHTGDLGRLDDEGFLWIEGRVSDMINRGGLKVFPEEVAEVIRLSPDVAECAVAGIPDERLGEVPWAFVVPRAGAGVDLDALDALCREHLAPYKVPAHFESLDALPRNEVGKVLLRELVTRRHSMSGVHVDMNLETVVIPVSDVDRAKAFYEGLGWRLDADLGGGDFRIVQFNPPGSGCSIQFGSGVTSAAPGSAANLLVVSDIGAAHDDLLAHGVDAEVFHDSTGGYDRFTESVRAKGPDPERRTYASFSEFRDPDGNLWQLQEITSRLPGRIDATSATFTSADELARALKRAEAAHGEHEKRTGERDEDWPSWYAAFMLAEQTGAEPPD